jgi:hypothetical protein
MNPAPQTNTNTTAADLKSAPAPAIPAHPVTGRKEVVVTLREGAREFTTRVTVPKHPRKGLHALASFLRTRFPKATVEKVEDVVPGGVAGKN